MRLGLWALRRVFYATARELARKVEPAMERQLAYLEHLSRKAGSEPPGEGLTKAEASPQIDALLLKVGR